MKLSSHRFGRAPILAISAIFVFIFGTELHAGVGVNPSSIAFGTQAVGTVSAPAVINLTNSGSKAVRFSGVNLKSSQFSYSGPTGSFSIGPGQSLSVSVSFEPTIAQAITANLVFVRYNGSRLTIALSGTGTTAANTTTVQPPVITTQPSGRSVTAGQTATFSVSVTGTSPLTYQWSKNGVYITGANSSSYTTPTLTTSDNGAQFAVTVSNSSGSVTSSSATLSVTAVTTTMLITLSPNSLSFGNVAVGASASQSVNVTNVGSSSVTISGVSYSGAGFATSGLGGQILAPTQTANLNVTFTPSAAGTVSGSVVVNSNAANSPGMVTLSGSGIQPVTHSTQLSWLPVTSSSIAGYQVYGSTSSGGPYNRLTASPLSSSLFTDSAVQSGKTYFYVVTSVGTDSVESSYSNQVSALIP